MILSGFSIALVFGLPLFFAVRLRRRCDWFDVLAAELFWFVGVATPGVFFVDTPLVLDVPVCKRHLLSSLPYHMLHIGAALRQFHKLIGIYLYYRFLPGSKHIC